MILIIFASLCAILGYIGMIHIFPDFYWFKSFGVESLFLTTLTYQAVIFLLIFSVGMALLYMNRWMIKKGLEQVSVFKERHGATHPTWLTQLFRMLQTITAPYQSLTQTLGKNTRFMLYGFISFIFAQVSLQYWDQIVLFFHSQPFGKEDPIFFNDISFYIFQLPVIQNAVALLLAMVILLLLMSVWSYFRHILLIFSSSFAFIRVHIGGLLLVVCMIIGVQSYFRRYDLLYINNELFFGAGFTDFHLVQPVLKAMPIVWVVIFGLGIAFIIRPSIKLVIASLVLIILVPIIGLSIIPNVYQNYVVAPNELEKELPFIRHNIQFTQAAFGLDGIDHIPIDYKRDIDGAYDASFQQVVNNIRLWNPDPLKSTLKQLQEMRLYYEFAHVDVDRYLIDGVPQQVMLSARELDVSQLSAQAKTWVNQHLIFTHGYGLCMVPVNRVNSEGLPELIIRDIPPIGTSTLQITRPEIYFGESTNHYVVVNTNQKEFDYPQSDENQYTHYSENGGIELRSLFKRLLYAIKLGDIKLLISQKIKSDSRLMFDRNIQQIPKKIAPFFAFDEDPYLIVRENGRLVWMIDGYTMSSKYPYATPYSRSVNYVRNSVLMTIDAYSGELHVYAKTIEDPIIQAYASIFPSVIQSMDALPTDILAHIRYPKDLFKLQSTLYNTYHMTDPQVFYNKEDLWAFPKETYDSDTGIVMEPYYMYVSHPDTGEMNYSMMIPLTPLNKNNLVAMLAVSSEPDTFGHMHVYKFPKQETVYGPLQIESRIDQDTDISKDLTLWGQVGSKVIRGNLMVIPYQQSLVYVEPIYLQATQSKLPELKRVIVAMGDQVVMADSFEDGLEQIGAPILKNMDKTVDQFNEGAKMDSDLTKKIIQLYTKMKDSLKVADWAAFGSHFNTLGSVVESMVKKE